MGRCDEGAFRGGQVSGPGGRGQERAAQGGEGGVGGDVGLMVCPAVHGSQSESASLPSTPEYVPRGHLLGSKLTFDMC